MELTITTSDPLGVLRSARSVMRSAQSVHLDRSAVASSAATIRTSSPPPASWGDDLHFVGDPIQTAGWVLTLDALNFCFWSEHPDRRWRVAYAGSSYDGYWALVAALRRAVDEGYPLWDAGFLSGLDHDTVAQILRPDGPNSAPIPLLADRWRNLVELGDGLVAWGGRTGSGTDPVEALLAAAGGSAIRLIELVTSLFPSFRDVTTIDGEELRFLKRAQILAADLHAALLASGSSGFGDLHALTAFADYKVPQVLRRLGVIDYCDELALAIDERQLIPPGSRQEAEIRAATIWGVELIRQELERLGHPLAAYEIDWALWQAGQSVAAEDRPYHRTLTIYY